MMSRPVAARSRARWFMAMVRDGSMPAALDDRALMTVSFLAVFVPRWLRLVCACAHEGYLYTSASSL